MIKIIIADDHPLIREGIKKVIHPEKDLHIIGEAEDGHEVLNLLQQEIPHMLILDITMPGKSGLELLKQINEQYPNLPVLILSVHSEERFAVRALRAGAYGYLTKSSISEDLIKAIRRIATQRRKYITPKVADQLASQVDANKKALPHEQLSDREFQIFCMIASGRSVTEIAEEFSLSPQTIHTYRTRIKEKMNLDSNVGMARYAIEHNLIE
ncbi:two component transcriptional regulator, LuxR family [Fodinibius roseus]|uniref:Two component transcriptional regulator, LuxR family n=1 Tax=Fodinibius roseus TaxID=1194090 RepID=A0A1M5EDI0_9BACT|nr:response regulator transcription factor [Fodinibius roseus]SHF77152.1 two component transcriptional regulator, LuxR family [Fodinibius roseus]